MAKVTYTGTLAGLRIGAHVFPNGEEVDVPSKVATEVLERDDFKKSTPPKSKAKTTNTGDQAE